MARTFPASETISPSVRLVERDFSAYGPGFSLCKGAMVGFCSKGQFNVPTLVRNRDELFTKFGFPNPDVGSYLIYAALEFLKQGNRLYVVRVGVTEEGDEDWAKTASVDVISAGGAATIFIPRYISGSEISYTPVGDVTHYLRIKTNDHPHLRMLSLPGETLQIVSDDDTEETVYTVLVAQQTDEDPFEITQLAAGNTTTDGIYIAAKVNGPQSKIELVSVKNDVYSAPVSGNGGLNINTSATTAKVQGTKVKYPLTSSNGDRFDFSALASLNLKIAVFYTGDDAIDNVVQTIPLPTGTGMDDLTIDQICCAINGSSARLANSFFARPANYILVRDETEAGVNYTTYNPDDEQLVSGGTLDAVTGIFDPTGASLGTNLKPSALGETAGTLVLETFARGRNSKILVKTQSTADAIFGLSNVYMRGTTADIALDQAIDQFETGYFHGDSTGDVNSFTVYSSTPGTEGNNVKVTISRDINSGDFSIAVYFHDRVVENFNRMNKRPYTANNPRNLEYWINGLSQYIVVEDNTDTEEGPLPGTYQLGATEATMGSDGIPDDVTLQAELIVGDEFLSTGLYSLSEPEKIDIDLVSVPGISTTEVWQGLQDLCEEQRTDCLGIVDPPQEMPPWEVIAWHNGLHPLNHVKMDTCFLALFWPWLKIRDSINHENIWVPPSGVVMGQIAYSEQVSHAWLAAAGLRRGILDQVIELEYHAYLKERDSMYGYQNSVNAITQFPDTGIVIWGNKTLQRRMTALDRINVRRLMFYLEKRIALNAKYYIFEPNDARLREQFTKMCNTICGFVKTERGLYDYIIICDETNNPDEVIDRNELRARVGVQPTKAAEFIFIEFTIHRKGSFEEAEPLK